MRVLTHFMQSFSCVTHVKIFCYKVRDVIGALQDEFAHQICIGCVYNRVGICLFILNIYKHNHAKTLMNYFYFSKKCNSSKEALYFVCFNQSFVLKN